MAKFTGELSGSLAFIESGVVQTQMIPGIESLNLTGSLNISGSQLTVNGRNVFGEIDALTAGANPDIGTLRIHSQSMLEYTSSTDIRLAGIEAYTGSVDQLNAATSSYYLQSDAANVVSSSNQIEALGFGRANVISGSDQIIDLGFNKDVVSGSQQILDLGFVTSSNIASYNDLTDVPSGLVSASVQVAELGFISGSEYYELGSIPQGIVSSSNQVETLLSNNSVDFGTGIVSASLFSGDGSGLTNLNIGQVASVRETFSATGSITVEHNFSSYNVNVAVYDTSNTLILPASIQLTSDNTAKVDFDSQTAGHIVVSLGGHIFTGSTAWTQVTEKPTGIVSSSAQITALGFGGGITDIPSGTVSSSAQITELGYVTGSTFSDLINKPNGLISSSTQINSLGYLTSASAAAAGFGSGGGGGGVSSYTQLSNVPGGIISSSAQVIGLGFITGSTFNQIVDIPSGLVSSSNQIESLGFITSSVAANLGGYATTGSNTFKGNQTISGSIIPESSINDLGSAAAPFRHLYVTSGSVKFMNPDGTELSSFNNQFDGNRVVSNTDHPLFNSFNPGSTGTIEEFLTAVFYPNTAPSITTGNQVIEEYTVNGTSIVTLAGTDAESQTITFSIDDSYTDGFVIVDNGVLKLNTLPTATAFNTDDRGDGTLAHPIVVKATDTIGASSTKTIYIRVTPNAAPIFRENSVSGNQITSFSTSRNENASSGEVTKIYFTDTESDSVTINSGSDPNGHFSITKYSTYVAINQVTASLDYENITSYSMSITASDAHYEDGDDSDSFVQLPITITVTDNTQPTVNNQTISGLNENSSAGTTAGTISASDPEGDTITFKNARLFGLELDGSEVPTGSYSGTAQLTDPTEDAFTISSTGVVTRKNGVHLNSDLINEYQYEVIVTDPYNNGSDKGIVSIPITDDTAPTISGDTTLYVIESATSGNNIFDNTDGYSGTTSRFTSNQTVTWAVSSSNDFSINSNGYLTLARDISGSADVGGDQLDGVVTATNSFGTTSTQAFTVNITDNGAPSITFSNTSANLNTNKARPGNNLVTMTFSDSESDNIDYNSFSASLGGHDLTVVTSGNSRIVRANSNLTAGTYNVTASIADVEGFATRTSSHAFTVAQSGTGTLSTNGTFRIIESAVDGALIRTNSNGRTGTQADVGVSYSPNYGSQVVQAFTSSNAAIEINSSGELSLGLNISGSTTGSGDTVVSSISFQDQYGNIGSGNITVNVVANNNPSVTVSEQGSLESDNISNGTTVATVAVSDVESDYPATVNLSGTDASDFSITSTNDNGTSWNITANSSLAAGTYSFVVNAIDAFGKTGSDTASIVIAQSADYGLVYVYTSTYGSDAGFGANYLGVMGGSTVNSDVPPEVTAYTANTASPFYKFKSGDIGSTSISLAGSATATLQASGSGSDLDSVLSGLDSISAATTGQVIIVFPSGSDMTVPTSIEETFNSVAGGAVPCMNVDGNGFGIESGNLHSITLDSAHLGYSEWFVFGRKSTNAIASGFKVRLVAANGSLPS